MSPIERIGISTHFLPAANGESLWDAIDQVQAMGLRGFELVPDDYGEQVAEPYVPSVGVWAHDLSHDDRDCLREALALFDTVTLHANHLDLNIASMNPGIRSESERQCLECLELAAQLGASVVSFHRGSANPVRVHDLTEIERHNIEFGLRAAKLAEAHDLLVGFTVGGPGGLDSQMRELLAIDSDRVGINLDVARAAIAGPPPEIWAREFAGQIIEVQVCGVFRDWSGLATHEPIERNNVIDYEALLAELQTQSYDGPVICEIEGFDIENAVSHALAARAILREMWTGA